MRNGFQLIICGLTLAAALASSVAQADDNERKCKPYPECVLIIWRPNHPNPPTTPGSPTGDEPVTPPGGDGPRHWTLPDIFGHVK